MEVLKILLVSNMYPNEKHPSYGVFVKNTEEILINEGFHIDRIVLFKQESRWKKLLFYILFYIKIVLRCLFSKYDIVYVHYAAHTSIPLNFVRRFKKIKIFTNVHGSDVVPEVKSQEKFQKHVNILLHNSAKIITPSQYYRNLVSNKYGIDQNKIEVFPSGGVNFNYFHRLDKEISKEKLNLQNDMNYIGYVGRIDVKKGWDVFLLALKLLKDEQDLDNLKAVIVGNGKQADQLDRMIQAYGLEDYIVRFNLMPQKELIHVYNAIDVFCFPTMREGESLGLVGLEAMACGTPIIASEIGGILDYTIHTKNGYLFEPGNSLDLKEKIKSFFLIPNEEREKMAEEAIETARKYEIESIKPKLINIFNTITR